MKDLVLSLIIVSSTLRVLFAQTIESPSYKLLDLSVNSGSQSSSSNDFKSSNLVGGEGFYISSSAYKIYTDREFLANTPKIKCVSTGYIVLGTCDNAPNNWVSNFESYCGKGGCFNRARLEIDTQNNPIDTLYAVYISKNADFSDPVIVDGITFYTKDIDLKELSDYLKINEWHSPTFNIRGLDPNTTYYFKVSALHGDLTESELSPLMSNQTSQSEISLDINIGDNTGTETNSSPYSIDISGETGYTKYSEDYIWVTNGINLDSGVVANIINGNEGILGLNTGYLVPSTTEDIENYPYENIGLQFFNSIEEFIPPNGGSSSVSINSIFYKNYSSRTNNVGRITTTPTTLHTSTGIQYENKVGYKLLFKYTENTPADRYSTNLTITLFPNI